MAFNSNPPKQSYQATEGQTVFPFIFKIYADDNLAIYIQTGGEEISDSVPLILGVDYTASVDGDNGGVVTLNVGADAEDIITIYRALDITRLVDYQTSGDLLANTLNADQDYQTYLILDISSKINDIVAGEYPGDQSAYVLKAGDVLTGPLRGIAPINNADLTRKDYVDAASTAITNSLFINANMVDTIAELEVQSGYAGIMVVSDTLRGGEFIYDASLSGVNNGGTVFDGWVRQFTGQSYAPWYGVENTPEAITLLTPQAGEYFKVDDDLFGESILTYNGAEWDTTYLGESQSQAQIFWQSVNGNESTSTMIVMGDSTGNANTEWVYLYAQWLGDTADRDVDYYMWDDTLNTYTKEVIESMTGNQKIEVYNASVSGANNLHFLGSKRKLVFADIDFDMVVYNFGHNNGTNATREEQFKYFIGMLANTVESQPNAGHILTLQNINTDFQEFSFNTVQAIRSAASLLGMGVVDVYSVFAKIKNRSQSEYDSLMLDAVHPNDDGMMYWRNAAILALNYSHTATPSAETSLMSSTGNNLSRNSYFSQWQGALPDHWKIGEAGGGAPTCEVAKGDSTHTKSFIWSLKMTSLDSFSFVQSDLSSILSLFKGDSYFAAALVYDDIGNTSNSGRIAVSIDGVQTSSQSSDEGHGGWRWVYVTGVIPAVADLASLMLFGGEAGDVTYFDRVIVGKGKLPFDCQFDGAYPVLSDYYFADNAGTIDTGTFTVDENHITLVGNEAQTRFWLNLKWLDAGEQYQITYVDASSEVGIMFLREGIDGEGDISDQTALDTLDWTFTATQQTMTLLFSSDSATVPATLDISDISIVKV